MAVLGPCVVALEPELGIRISLAQFCEDSLGGLVTCPAHPGVWRVDAVVMLRGAGGPVTLRLRLRGREPGMPVWEVRPEECFWHADPPKGITPEGKV